MWDPPYISGPPDPTEHCCDDWCCIEELDVCNCDCAGCSIARRLEREADKLELIDRFDDDAGHDDE